MVRVTPFLPLVSGTATLLAATATDHRQESYAALTAHPKRELLTCEQTYGANWTQCGDANSTYCYNPSEGQTCCARDAGYCDAGAWCAPVAGYCCLDDEDAGTCAQNAGFTLPASVSSGYTLSTSMSSATYAMAASTTIITHFTTVTLTECPVTPTTLGLSSSSVSSADVVTATPSTTVGGLTWSSIYPATVTGFLNGSSSANSTGSAASSSPNVVVSEAKKEQLTLFCMTLAMGVVGAFMLSC